MEPCILQALKLERTVANRIQLKTIRKTFLQKLYLGGYDVDNKKFFFQLSAKSLMNVKLVSGTLYLKMQFSAYH